MNRLWTGIVCAIPLLVQAQKKPGPCSAQLFSSTLIDRICLEALPESGWLEFSDSTAKACSCDCDSLLSLTYAEVIRLRQQRDSLYRSNFGRYLKLRSLHHHAPMSTNGRAVTVDASGRATWHIPDTCLRDLQVVEFIQSVLSKEFITLDPDKTFEFILDAEISDLVFPKIQAIENDGLIHGWLRIPRRLLSSPFASKALLDFLLLHEIGHAVRLDESEYSADTWASFIGLNRMLPPVLLDWTFLRRNITTDLRKYIMSQFHPDDAPLASPEACRSVQNCYPELECRLKGILGMYAGWRDLGQMDRGYPQDCWMEHVGTAHRLREPSWERPACAVCKQLQVPTAPPGEVGELWTKLGTEITRISTICDRVPGSCTLRNTQLIFTMDGKGKSVSSKQLERSLSGAIKHAQRVTGSTPK